MTKYSIEQLIKLFSTVAMGEIALSIVLAEINYRELHKKSNDIRTISK